MSYKSIHHALYEVIRHLSVNNNSSRQEDNLIWGADQLTHTILILFVLCDTFQIISDTK